MDKEDDLPFEYRGVGNYWARLPPDSIKCMGDPRLNSDTPIWAEGVMPNKTALSIYDSPKKTVRYGGIIGVEITADDRARFEHDLRIARELDEAAKKASQP